ncbi:MAG: hypothetical protein EOM20_03975 [Spartobacteria bacterium]|nr:hypothetical protein [Spartobacteria bacterium]
MKTTALLLIGLLALQGVSADYLSAWDMDEGIRTRQNGYYNHFKHGDSTADVQLTREARRGPGGRAMQVVYNKPMDGYCGVWAHFFDEEQAKDGVLTCLDVAGYPYLSFFVRGAKGGENFTIQLADPAWYAREDSQAAGTAVRYLGRPLTTNWTEIIVPLEDFRLASTDICGITFNFTEEGAGTVYIDDIGFKKLPDTPVPFSTATPENATPDRAINRAMWVWETEPLLDDPQEAADLFAFCRAHQVNELFLQLLYTYENDGSPDVRCIIRKPDLLRAFLRAAHEDGLRIHALDGHPEYVLRENHPKVLAQVDALLAFNEGDIAQEQLDGIHLDNEPYLLPGFESVLQEDILRQYLELNAAIMARLREQGSAMVFGVDIPFWFDERPGECLVTWNGQRKDAAKHILDIVDNIGIMDYRNFAGGADGMIKHAEQELAYAAQVNTPVYLGVETYQDTPLPFYFVCMIPEAEWAAFARDHADLMNRRDFRGFRMKTYRDGTLRYWGIGQDRPGAPSDRFLTAVAALAALNPTDWQEVDWRPALEQALRIDPACVGFQPLNISLGGEHPINGFTTAMRMPPKTTFAGKSKQALEAALKETADHYRDNPAFHGFAIHYYKTYRELPDE